MYELLCILSKYYAYYTLSNRVLVVDTREYAYEEILARVRVRLVILCIAIK